MEAWSKVFPAALWLWTCLALTHQAMIGDGRVSLYTGRPITNSTGGRGSCEVDGRTYPSETAIARDHPCHYCICYQSQVTCYWKQCAAAPRDCDIMHFDNVCNPSLYMCSIPKKAMAMPKRRFGDRISPLKRKRLVRSAAPPTPLHHPLPVDEPFPVQLDEEFVQRVERSLRVRRAVDHHHHHLNDPADKSCTILGVKYNLGEVIGVASGVCMECRCAAGKMFCSPRCCFLPSPFAMSSAHAQQLQAQQSDRPPRPHPLSYVRNQYIDGTLL